MSHHWQAFHVNLRSAHLLEPYSPITLLYAYHCTQLKICSHPFQLQLPHISVEVKVLGASRFQIQVYFDFLWFCNTVSVSGLPLHSGTYCGFFGDQIYVIVSLHCLIIPLDRLYIWSNLLPLNFIPNPLPSTHAWWNYEVGVLVSLMFHPRDSHPFQLNAQHRKEGEVKYKTLMIYQLSEKPQDITRLYVWLCKRVLIVGFIVVTPKPHSQTVSWFWTLEKMFSSKIISVIFLTAAYLSQ